MCSYICYHIVAESVMFVYVLSLLELPNYLADHVYICYHNVAWSVIFVYVLSLLELPNCNSVN